MYLLKRDDGAYVADTSRTGGSSYTRDLRKARVYPSQDAAMRDQCGNERLTTVEEEMR